MTRLILAGAQSHAHAHLGDVLIGYGLFRAISEQVDPDATLWWSAAGPVLDTVLDDVPGWLLTDYAPSPVVCPWNAGSGFGLGWGPDGRQKISTRACPDHDVLVASSDPRVDQWRATVLECRRLVEQATARGWTKPGMVTAARGRLPDTALPWIDTAVAVIGDAGDRLVVNPLAGTGGNVGSADLGVVTARYVVRALGLDDAAAVEDRQEWARSVVTGQPSQRPLVEGTGLIYFPQSPPEPFRFGLINPFGWLLAMEGIGALAGSLIGREQVVDQVLFPTLRPITTGAPCPEPVHAETWLPMWGTRPSYREARMLVTDPELWGTRANGPFLAIDARPELAAASCWGHWQAGNRTGVHHLGVRPADVPEVPPAGYWWTVSDVAAARGISDSTIRAYLSRPGSRMPSPTLTNPPRWRLPGPIQTWAAKRRAAKPGDSTADQPDPADDTTAVTPTVQVPDRLTPPHGSSRTVDLSVQLDAPAGTWRLVEAEPGTWHLHHDDIRVGVVRRDSTTGGRRGWSARLETGIPLLARGGLATTADSGLWRSRDLAAAAIAQHDQTTR
jgi:hypothetical protein